MDIYRIKTDYGLDRNDVYCDLLAEPLEIQQKLRKEFRGEPFALETWQPFKVIRDYSRPDNLTKPLGDRAVLNSLLGILVLSRRALDALLPHIGHLGQALPIEFDECEYQLFNITNVVDALDDEAAQIWRFPSSGRIGQIERYAFKPAAVRDQLLFKIPQQPGGFAFCTDRFVDLVKQHGLTGFGFEQVWSDQTQPLVQTAKAATAA
jgi:hypothetical protein